MLEIIPPTSQGRCVAINGYLVPNIRVNETRDTAETGRWNINYGERFCMLASLEEMQRWLPFLAHVQAISEGFSCHGKESRPHNPHAVRVMRMDCVQSQPAEGATDTQAG